MVLDQASRTPAAAPSLPPAHAGTCEARLARCSGAPVSAHHLASNCLASACNRQPPTANHRYDTRVMTVLVNVTFKNYAYQPELGAQRPAVWYSMVQRWGRAGGRVRVWGVVCSARCGEIGRAGFRAQGVVGTRQHGAGMGGGAGRG